MAGIKEVAQKTGIDPQGVRAVLDAIKNIADSGEKVQLQKFGTFEVKKTAERNGFNPKTKEPIVIPAGTRFAFKPSKAKKD